MNAVGIDVSKGKSTVTYETPYWVHPSLRMTQPLYDSILPDLLEPISFTKAARRNCVSPETVQAVFDTIRIRLPKKLPETICIDEFKDNTGVWGSRQVVSQYIPLQHFRQGFPRGHRHPEPDPQRLREQVFPPVFSGAAEAGKILLLRYA